MKFDLLKRSASFAIFAVLLLAAPIAFAGGSTFGITILGDQIGVSAGQTGREILRMEVNTYGEYREYRFETLDITCDKIPGLKTAELRMGDSVIGSGSFVAHRGMYLAQIKMKPDTATDKEVSNFSINLDFDDLHTGPAIATCGVSAIQMYDIKNDIHAGNDRLYFTKDEIGHIERGDFQQTSKMRRTFRRVFSEEYGDPSHYLGSIVMTGTLSENPHPDETLGNFKYLFTVPHAKRYGLQRVKDLHYADDGSVTFALDVPEEYLSDYSMVHPVMLRLFSLESFVTLDGLNPDGYIFPVVSVVTE